MILDNKRLPIDVVIPVYGERPDALSATLSACLKQTHPISRIFVVDDGSPRPVSLPGWAQSSGQIYLLRLNQNGGISAARNAGLANSNTPLVACVNTEVLPDPDWLETCVDYLFDRASVGAVYTRLVPLQPNRLFSQWRMRFLEAKFDSLKQLALKELRESYWYSPAQSSLIRLYLHLSKWTLIRAGRNLVKGRWGFLPLDAAIWACALWTATIRTLRYFLRSDGEIAKQAPE